MTNNGNLWNDENYKFGDFEKWNLNEDLLWSFLL